MKKRYVPIIVIILVVITSILLYNNTQTRFQIATMTGLKDDPTSINSSIEIEKVAIGLPLPKYMTVVNEDILFTQQYTSNIFLIKEGKFIKIPIINLEESKKYRVHGLTSKDSKVYVHYSEIIDNEDNPFGKNYFFKYDWDGNSLNNPRPVEVTKIYTDTHHVGPMFIDNNSEVFVTFDVDRLNSINDEYVAYGMHGFIKDPVSGNIWLTSEEDFYDDETYDRLHLLSSDPIKEINTWNLPFYPDSLAFPLFDTINTYPNSLFIGDCKGPSGTIYELKLNQNRDNFTNIAYENDLLQFSETHVFADGFKCVSDLEFGSDGSLYVVSNAMNGAIYKISML